MAHPAARAVGAPTGPDARGGARPAGRRRGGARSGSTTSSDDTPATCELIDQLAARYEHEASHVWPHGDGPRDEAEQELLDHLEIRTAVLDAEREAVIRLRDDGIISDEVLHRIERDLDLEALRTGV